MSFVVRVLALPFVSQIHHHGCCLEICSNDLQLLFEIIAVVGQKLQSPKKETAECSRLLYLERLLNINLTVRRRLEGVNALEVTWSEELQYTTL